MTDPASWVQQRLITDAYLTQLRSVLAPAATVYDAEVPVTMPVLGQQWSTSDPTTPGASITGAADASGRIAPYVVVHSPAGNPVLSEVALEDANVDSAGIYYLTLVGPFRADVEQLVTAVQAASYRWQPAVAGHVFGLMRPPVGFTAPPIRRDDTLNPQPPCYTASLQYSLTSAR